MRLERILIGNRGEIVERVIRTARRLGVETVAVYSDIDRSSRFVRLADAAVPLGGATAAESYLDQDRVIDAALASGADAVHPGYGFLAENAEFARRCGGAGLVFIGPTPSAIKTMGDKVAAKAVARAAEVPLLPTLELDDINMADSATVRDAVGWPVIVKASAGGGGKGMHIVTRSDDLARTVKRAQREAASAFGDGRVFIEPYVTGGRHVEVQVFGDCTGAVTVLHERECTVQRRHQKVVEEAPSPSIGSDVRNRLHDAARRLARAVDYRGAGTVEFLLAADGEFYFLEMNTRLQVEHAVTEAITGLDLVELQILVAEGKPLPPGVFDPPRDGCAIEVRLYAEDPADGFSPATGELLRFTLSDEQLRVETGFVTGDQVTPYYDPMLAKLIASAPDRVQAARRLAARLAESRIDGVTTNRDLLVRILRDERFLNNHIDTQFLDDIVAAGLADPLATPAIEARHAIAATLAAQAQRHDRSLSIGFRSGWRNNRAMPQQVVLSSAHETWNVSYEVLRRGVEAIARGGSETVVVDDAPHVSATDVDLVVAGVRRRYAITLHGNEAWVTGEGAATGLVFLPRFPEGSVARPGSLSAPMPGVIVRVPVVLEAPIEKGDVIAVLEAMKMELEVVAPHAGRLASLAVTAGDQVEAGQILAIVEEPT